MAAESKSRSYNRKSKIANQNRKIAIENRKSKVEQHENRKSQLEINNRQSKTKKKNKLTQPIEEGREKKLNLYPPNVIQFAPDIQAFCVVIRSCSVIFLCKPTGVIVMHQKKQKTK
jgi:hypothetical protein